jgi:hypothetical protein
MQNRSIKRRRAPNSERVWALIRTAIIGGSLAVLLSAYATAALS